MKLLLVALDASLRAPKVLDTAVHLAQKTGAQLLLLRVVGLPPDVPFSPVGTTPDGFLELLVNEGKTRLEHLAATVPKELVASTETRVGVAWPTICEVAKERQVDLIIIGSHGYGGMDRLLGTTASKVVNHADCSVLVARNLDV